MSTELMLRSFNGVAQQKSYGGKSLQQNLENAQAAIERVKYTEKIWDRSRSQFALKFIVCSNADKWLRMRQISAEMNTKRMALSEAVFGHMKNVTEAKIFREDMLEEDNKNKKLLLEIEAAKLENMASEMITKIEGAFKEVECLAQMHDQLKAEMGDVTEEEFEKAQVKSHIKRALNQAIREVKEGGKIKAGNAEYLEQSGLCTTSILKDIYTFLEAESEANVGHNNMLHKFLDDTAEKYGEFYLSQAEWLGFDPLADKNLTYEE
jgi:hypothetical protein